MSEGVRAEDSEYQAFVKRMAEQLKLKSDDYDVDSVVGRMETEGFAPQVTPIIPKGLYLDDGDGCDIDAVAEEIAKEPFPLTSSVDPEEYPKGCFDD